MPTTVLELHIRAARFLLVTLDSVTLRQNDTDGARPFTSSAVTPLLSTLKATYSLLTRKGPHDVLNRMDATLAADADNDVRSSCACCSFPFGYS